MDTNTLNICLFQTDISWKAVASNLRHYEACLANMPLKPDVLIFPEMFNTGFAVDTVQLAETMEGESVAFLQHIARKYDTAVVASLAILENNAYYNRLLWVMPDGSLQSYDKRHLFRMASEEHLFTHGRQQLVINYKGWKFLPLICYDLRFPVWSRNTRKGDDFLYDCLIYIANWPSSRMAVFNTLLQARAIENQSYVVAVNRVGEDGNHLQYTGQSLVLDPLGRPLTVSSDREELFCITLHKDELTRYRSQFPVSLDWDEFTFDKI